MREVYIDKSFSPEALAIVTKRSRKSERLRVALASSPDCQDVLAKFVLSHGEFFRNADLYGTSGTARKIVSHLAVDVTVVGHGPDGGDLILAGMVLKRDVDILIFLRSANEVFGHEPDMQSLHRAAIMTNCIYANTLSTAGIIIDALSAIETGGVAENRAHGATGH